MSLISPMRTSEQIVSLLTESFDPEHNDAEQVAEKILSKTAEARPPLLLRGRAASAS
jgi:hypothetical protein